MPFPTPAGKSKEDASAILAEAREVHERVRRGYMLPVAAEEWAQKVGMGTFQRRPDPSVFDPMGTEGLDWTPLMAIAWIATRDIERVRDFAPEFCRQWTVWMPTGQFVPTDEPHRLSKDSDGLHDYCAGFELRRLALGFDGLGYEDLLADNKEPPQTIASAKDRLWDQLRSGALEAHGDAEVEADIIIPSHQWSSLYFEPGKPGNFVRLREATCYRNVLISREPVLKIWPESLSSINGCPSERSTVCGKLDESSAARLIRSEKLRREKAALPFNQNDAEKYLKSIDPLVNRAIIRAALAAETGNRAPGRPPKRANSHD